MSENQATWVDRVEAQLSRFSAREQILLGVMVVVLGCLLVVAVAVLMNARASALDQRISDQREVLAMLVEERDAYRVNAAENARIEELLASNDLRLSSFIEARAGRLSIARPREFRDQEQALDGGVEAESTTAEFAGMEIEQLSALLTAIEEAEELVFTRQIAVAPARRGNEGLEVELTLVTFKRTGGT